MSKVLIPLAVGFEEIEAMTLIDVLRRAGIEVVTAGLDRKMLQGAHGVNVEADTLLDSVSVSEFDMILLPGGLPGAEHLAKSEKVKSLLQEFDANNKYIGAICAAPWALSTAGVLKDKYTCYPGFEGQVAKDGYDGTSDVVIDHNIMTSRGPATAMSFALCIVKELCGIEKHDEIQSGLLAS